MSININSKLFEKAKPDFLDFDHDGNEKESMKKALHDKSKKKMSEAKKQNAKFWWDDDGDGIGYEKGEVSGKFNKKKKVTKESYSNWREELSEVAEFISKDKNDQKITEKKVNNKIKINPTIGEAISNLGGTLIEMNEIEDFNGVFDDLSESEIFLLSDSLIEEVVEEFFYECLQEGYDLEEVENTLLESLEISSALLNEARVTYGHDTDVKSDRLKKVKSAVKNAAKKVAHGAGYVAGLAVRGSKSVGRELKAGYKKGTDDSSSGSEESSSGSGSSRPGLLGRIGSALKSGLKRVISKGARKVARGALGVAHRMEKEKPSPVHSRSGSRSASPRSGIGGGKKIEVAGSGKSEPEVKKVKVTDVTPRKQEAPVGTSENPRVGQPGPEKPKSTRRKKATTKTTKVTKSSSTTSKPKPKSRRGELSSAVDDVIASMKSEETQLNEKSLSISQQQAAGAALAAKRGDIKPTELKGASIEMYKSMTQKQLRDFAKTKHEGLPKKKTKEEAVKEELIARMRAKIAEQALELQPKTQTQQQTKEKPLDTAAERQKYANLKMMQQKQQQLEKQRLNLKKQGKLPLEDH